MPSSVRRPAPQLRSLALAEATAAAPAARPRRKAQAQMSQTVILGTARTPFGKMGGGLSSLDATDLGGRAIASALERSEVEPEQVEAVVYGQVLQAGQGQIPSRQAQMKAAIPREVPSETVNKVCASGMRSIGIFDQAIDRKSTRLNSSHPSRSYAVFCLKNNTDDHEILATRSKAEEAMHR